MEWNFSALRLLVLCALIGVYWLLGGFSLPELPREVFGNPRRLGTARFQCTLLFCAGGAIATLIDHHIGNIDRTNLRPFYILLGLAMMVIGWLWLRGLQSQFDLMNA